MPKDKTETHERIIPAAMKIFLEKGFEKATMREIAEEAGITAAGGDADIVNIVEDTTHQSANDIMQARGLVDLLIPRGGAGLIRACVENAAVPCI